MGNESLISIVLWEILGNVVWIFIDILEVLENEYLIVMDFLVDLENGWICLEIYRKIFKELIRMKNLSKNGYICIGIIGKVVVWYIFKLEE